MTAATVVAVRERRREQRTTQAELAAAVGVSRQTIISIERGEHAPSVYLALRIARWEALRAAYSMSAGEKPSVRSTRTRSESARRATP